MRIPLATKTSEVRSREVSPERLVNWYAEPGGKGQFSLKPTPGLDLFSAVNPSSGSSVRGLWSCYGRFFCVAGNQLFELSNTGVATLRGTLAKNSGRVTIRNNGTQLIVCEDGSGWILTLATNVFAQITDVDYPASNVVEYQDGYFIMPFPDTEDFYISAGDDGTSWNADDLTNADGTPDNIQTIIRNGRNLWVMQTGSTEVYYNSGNVDFPFDRVQGAESEVGAVSKFSVCQIHDKIFWVGANGEGQGMVWMSQGYTPSRISNHAVEYDLNKMSFIDDAEAFCYQSEGHVFYVVSFQGGGKTWVYDLTTGLWHERMYWDADNHQERKIRVSTHTFFNGKNYVGDSSNNNVYELSETTYTDNGDEIVRICQTPNVHAERKRVFFSDFELDLERGVGLITGQGSDPQIMMEYSNDGGHTWKGEKWRSAGAIGKYNKKVTWHGLGQARSRSFRIKTSDPVNYTIIDAFSELSVGNG